MLCCGRAAQTQFTLAPLIKVEADTAIGALFICEQAVVIPDTVGRG